MATDATDRQPALRPPANRVSPRAVWYWVVRALAGWLVVVAGQVVALVLDWPLPPLKVPLLVATGMLAATHVAVMPAWRYRVHRWELTDTAVSTRTGWWTQEWRIAPLTRVQTVDSARGPLARLFGLTTLTVTTASAAGPVGVEGLDERTAAALAARITAAAQASRGDAT
jgi:membrane protein YdbS with pleckstrin-like domain